jgi:hypothetical protein
MLCDGCDKVRRFVWSTDGRSLHCWHCRLRYPRETWRIWRESR